METDRLGSIEHIRAQNFSDARAIMEYIKELRKEGFSYDEIQMSLYRAGYSVDNTTIRLASNR